MNKRELDFLKRKRFVVGVPTTIKFKLFSDSKIRSFKATRGTYVVKYSDILKLKKSKKGERR